MAAMSKADYLKRYMSGPDAEELKAKKKRKKKPVNAVKTSGFKVVDEDVGFGGSAVTDANAEEEAPTVAEVIDERPEEVRQLEEYKMSKKWKTMGADDEKRDSSPPRRQYHDSDQSPPRQRRRHDSDQSPPRRQRHDSDQSPPRRQRHDSDQSPPRRQRHNSDQSPPRRTRRQNSDSDLSPPRRGPKNDDSDLSPPRKQKTLSGKLAGLSSARDMKEEAEKLRRKEAKMFAKVGEDELGRNAATVFRDKATGRRRDVNAEKEESDAKLAKWQEKYQKWNKGVAQGKAEMERAVEVAHEMSKPMARDKDDADLEAHLKEQDREGDPMLEFIKKKKAAKSKAPVYPMYKGPAPPPNRFGIRPGYRWDGVDRSIGFEKKLFESMSHKKAVASEAYKWSTEDM